MGNVHSAPLLSQKIDNKIPATTGLSNPGPLEEIHKRCKDVFPTNFDGAVLVVSRSLSNHFNVSHTVTLSHAAPSGYKFGASYLGTKQVSPTEAFPALLGDIDPRGNMNANITHEFLPSIRGKFAAQIQEARMKSSQIGLEYRANTFTACCEVADVDLINETGTGVFHYLQGITKHLSVGTELACTYNNQVPGGVFALASLAARYNTDKWSLSATVGRIGLNLFYFQKASEQLKIGVQLESNFVNRHSHAAIAYQIEFPRRDVLFRGHIDSTWCVGAVLEKRLNPMPITLAFSGLLSHKKNQFRLGVGLIIG